MGDSGFIVRSRWRLVAASVVVCCVGFGCSKKDQEKAAPQPTQETPPPPPTAAVETVAPMPAALPVPGPGAVEAKASGTLTVNPSPVPVCDSTGMGVATVSWKVEGAKNVEVHLDKPDGTIFAADKKSQGSQKTGPWVKKDLTLFLQDADNNYPRDANYTLAKVTVEVVGGGPCQ